MTHVPRCQFKVTEIQAIIVMAGMKKTYSVHIVSHPLMPEAITFTMPISKARIGLYVRTSATLGWYKFNFYRYFG